MKPTLLLLTTLCSFIYANAQNDETRTRKINFGIAAGVNYTTSPTLSYVLSDYEYLKSIYAPGFAGKLFMEYHPTATFSLQPEAGYVYYHQKQVYSTSPDYSSAIVRRLHNVKITAITVGNMFKYATKYITVLTGPQLDFTLSAAINQHSFYITSIGRTEVDYKYDMKEEKNIIITPVFNWIFGLEHKIIDKVFIQANYQLGLSNYTKPYIVFQIGKTSGFYLGGAYHF